MKILNAFAKISTIALLVCQGCVVTLGEENSTKILDNDRVLVWDFTWAKGMKTDMHFHDKDVVIVYLGSGTVRSIPLKGEPTAAPRPFGEAVFVPRGRTHVEECIDGPRRDIIIELK